MMKQQIILVALMFNSLGSAAQQDSLINSNKKRLDFAKAYFELGGGFYPSFTGKRLSGQDITGFEHPASFNTTLYWGAFHFWGHAEFFVSFPLKQFNLSSNDQTDVEFKHFTVTGARFLPWAFQEKKIRPYIGLSWSALDFQQVVKPEDDQPVLQKNFSWTADVGVLYGFKNFAARLGLNYFPDNQWDYPLSKTQFQQIETPRHSIQLGVIYTMESSKMNTPEQNTRWNNYPRVSGLGINADRAGDFFIALGPSISFSLAKSEYNQTNHPYLNQKHSSEGYFDAAIGYQFNRAGMFTALSFRNPVFEQSAYGTTETIKKTSVALETVKFLTDYSGFAPYVGLNIAYDHIEYLESTDANSIQSTFNRIEPGLTFGWDIVPGKSEEFFILRTNLRWYPFSSFQVDGLKFNFSQLEYNLIQAVFYPGRFIRSKR